MGDMGGMGDMDTTGDGAGDGGVIVAPVPDDGLGAQVVHSMPGAINVDGGKEAFDELFSKFCSAGLNEFAYFDQCWAPLNKNGPGVLTDGQVMSADGQLV